MRIEKLSMKGKVALVTGASRGIGLGVAQKLALAGASVLISDLNPGVDSVAREFASEGWNVEGTTADVGKTDDVAAMVETGLRLFGRIDILVNNAGVLRGTSPLETISDGEWEMVMNVNVGGAFRCSRAVLPLMKEQGYGKIVNVSSIVGRSCSNFGGAHYTASKAALLGLTRHAAREAAPYGINVNAIAPAGVDTQMIPDVSPDADMDAIVRKVPLGRLASTSEIGDLVWLLASDHSNYITGACVDINGGLLML